MAAARCIASRTLLAALVLPPLAAAMTSSPRQDWIPGLISSRDGAGSIVRSLLAPTMQYGRLGFVAHSQAGFQDQGKPATAAAVVEPTPARHRLVVCNAYRGAMALAAIHKRPHHAAIPARWQREDVANKILISGIPFKTCDVSRMEFKEGDSVLFRMGGMDVGSFNTSGALGLSAGQEVSLVLVPYRRLGQASQGAQFVSHVFRTPKQKVGSQVIMADTLKHISESVLKMEDRSGRLWPVHDDQEVTLQPGTYKFSAVDLKGVNVSSTKLQVGSGSKNGNSAKYLVLRLEPEPFSVQEFLTFVLPVPTTMRSGSPGSSATPTHLEDTDGEPTPAAPSTSGPRNEQVVSTAQLANVRQKSGSPAVCAFTGGPLLAAAALLSAW